MAPSQCGSSKSGLPLGRGTTTPAKNSGLTNVRTITTAEIKNQHQESKYTTLTFGHPDRYDVSRPGRQHCLKTWRGTATPKWRHRQGCRSCRCHPGRHRRHRPLCPSPAEALGSSLVQAVKGPNPPGRYKHGKTLIRWVCAIRFTEWKDATGRNYKTLTEQDLIKGINSVRLTRTRDITADT